jgi:quercetin dioxygenase-like cupin family protein
MKNTIPVHQLKMDISTGKNDYEEEIFNGAIPDLKILHRVSMGKGSHKITCQENYVTFLLTIKGIGLLRTNNEQQIIEEESFALLPLGVQSTEIILKEDQRLHYLLFIKKLSDNDIENINPQSDLLKKLYYRRFKDCTPYTEEIKSANTISRTILPGGIVPRVALGTVEAMGPDKVGAHSHPMLEQLFVGLSDNLIKVYADNASIVMKEFSIVHIPLGSTHWVEVEAHCKMNYMWMDFFLTKDGEAWLNTHKPINE